MRKNNTSVPSVKVRGGGGPRTSITPFAVPRTVRPLGLRAQTSLPAGKVVPLAAFGLMRMDSVATGQCQIGIRGDEMLEKIANPIMARVQAHFVSTMVGRFDGMDALNLSWAGKAVGAAAVVPFIETVAWEADPEDDHVHKYLGLHAQPGTNINAAYLRAYNEIINHRSANLSDSITLRDWDDRSLAPAYWRHSDHFVPDFDQ